MRYEFVATLVFITGLFLYIIRRALDWARREPGRRFPDGVPVWYNERLRLVHSARYYRGRWWYNLEGIEGEVRQEEIV